MKLFTLLAGYAAGLAVAMKYRKDNGTSKLDTTAPAKEKFNSFLEEVVDIHKTAFADVKGFMKENFDDVQNFDDLQKKVSGIVSGFASQLESHLENAKNTGITKKDELLKIASDFYASHEATLETAKSKAASFTNIPEETIDSWLNTAREEITSAYHAIQSKFANPTETDEVAPVKKRAPRKPPVKKAE